MTDATLSRVNEYLQWESAFSPAALDTLRPADQYLVFAVCLVADEVPVDVVQKVLGHASLQTTSIYVQAEKKRALEQVAGYYARRNSLR